MGETDVDIRLQNAEFVAHVIALAAEFDGSHTDCLSKLLHSVGQLDLAAGTRSGMLKDVEDLGRKNASAENGVE